MCSCTGTLYGTVLMVWVELLNGLLLDLVLVADERPAHEKYYVSTVHFSLSTLILSSD